MHATVYSAAFLALVLLHHTGASPGNTVSANRLPVGEHSAVAAGETADPGGHYNNNA